jgi:hypothetical protein
MSKLTAVIVALSCVLSPVSAKQPLTYSHKLTSIIDHINTPHSTWEAGINTRWLLHDKEFAKKHMGARLTGGPKLTKLLHNTLGASLPEEFDARKQYVL